MTIALPSADPTFRHLARMVSQYPGHECEIGDDCTEAPAWWLTAPGQYRVPMVACQTHAVLESFEHGTYLPPVSA